MLRFIYLLYIIDVIQYRKFNHVQKNFLQNSKWLIINNNQSVHGGNSET